MVTGVRGKFFIQNGESVQPIFGNIDQIRFIKSCERQEAEFRSPTGKKVNKDSVFLCMCGEYHAIRKFLRYKDTHRCDCKRVYQLTKDIDKNLFIKLL